jgi:hypothetical protein
VLLFVIVGSEDHLLKGRQTIQRRLGRNETNARSDARIADTGDDKNVQDLLRFVLSWSRGRSEVN